MTTLYEEKVRCGVCGTESEYTGIGSTNAFGSADLDTRPPEMKRSTIFAWVRRCPECGYCDSDVSKSRPDSKAVTSGEEYRNQLNNPAFPELANSFLCKAVLDREAKDYGSATWALIHAAWACDDSDCPSQAMACRGKAADMHMLAETERQQVAEQSGAGTAILVDLLRRSGRLDQARELIAARRAAVTEDIIVRVLDFEVALIEKGDVSCHTIAEALGGKE